MPIKSIDFKNMQVDIDGAEYEDCTFAGCRIVYSGGDLPKFTNCKFQLCQWALEGAAKKTLDYLAWLNITGGNQVVESFIRTMIDPPPAGQVPS